MKLTDRGRQPPLETNRSVDDGSAKTVLSHAREKAFTRQPQQEGSSFGRVSEERIKTEKVNRPTASAIAEHTSAVQATTDPAEAQREGLIVRELSAAVTLGTLAEKHFGGYITLPGGQAYRDDLLARTGASGDPIEQMLVEQMGMLHLQLQRVHVKAALATGNEVTKILCGTVARLSAESRRVALAIRTYRSTPATRSVIVKQTGNGSGKQVAVVVQSRGSKDSSKRNNKVGSKQQANRESSKSKSKSAPRCCRPA